MAKIECQGCGKKMSPKKVEGHLARCEVCGDPICSTCWVYGGQRCKACVSKENEESDRERENFELKEVAEYLDMEEP